MALRIDPEGNEIRALRQVTDWRGKAVLEIGSGDGRLTRRLARLGARVLGIDSDPTLVRAARRASASRASGGVRFQVGTAEKLKLPSSSFDIVVFAWSL
jgi:2-polyprenyl-3-methyl-5-hydroxy-6-metoxy-1,4-benzoquinol methylase